VNIWG